MTMITEKKDISPFHKGELEIQDRLGVREQVHSYAPRVIRNHMPSEHREFFAQLPQLIVGSVDGQGRPWASMLVGRVGFISTPDENHMTMTARPLYGDPLAGNLVIDAPLGFLGIEFHSRRRNRLNGKISAVRSDAFEITVDQSFGNCPQYIQARGFDFTDAVDKPQVVHPLTRADKIGELERDVMEKADTFFIASVFSEKADDRRHGVDVSHRGGKPGFVQVVDENTIIFPDFSGNFHFNTLGNILLNPKAGLLFPDFETGDMIYVTGAAETVWDGPELEAFVGAERLVRITVDEIIRVEKSSPLLWDIRDYSPALNRTGSWQDVADKIEASQGRDSWRNFTVARIDKESETISSYYLTPEDGKAIADYKAGQYLPIRLNIEGQDEPVIRTYTVSETSNGDFYRLSIKREAKGLVSRFFHDRIKPGSIIEAMAPRGKFYLDTDSVRPVVLLSGGVGITPMIAMMNDMLLQSTRQGINHPVHFIHGTLNGQEHAFGAHLKKMAQQTDQLSVHIRYAAPHDDDQEHDSVGYIDAALLQSLLPLDDYDFYLCGPPPFMQALYETLSQLGVADNRISYESFGPAMVLKPSEHATKTEIIASDPVHVCFAKSGIEAEWQPEKGTLLELAESEGLTPNFSCRSGSCGSCVTKVKCGDVNYLDEPIAPHENDEVLICCSVPKPAEGEDSCGKEYGLILDL